MAAPVRERGELFGPRWELLADVLVLGLVTACCCVPLVTVPAALSNATVLLRRRLTGQPCTVGRYFTALRARAHGGDLAAGGLLLAVGALVAGDAALVTAGLPGAMPFAVFLTTAGAAAAVTGLRACAQPESAGDWRAALRAGTGRTVRDPAGSGLVLLALGTAAVCAWVLPPAFLLVPGPLAAALTAVELRGRLPDGGGSDRER